MAEGKQSIKITIADRSYPLNITASHEEVVRAAVKEINNNVEHFMSRYANRDVQDALSIAVLEMAVSLIKLKKDNQQAAKFAGDLENLSLQLEEYINTK